MPLYKQYERAGNIWDFRSRAAPMKAQLKI